MEQYSDAQLDALLGTGKGGYSRFRMLSVDNGTDLSGTGATGDFIEKIRENDTTKRVPYADVIQGVIVAAKSQLTDMAKNPSWRTGEFDASNVDEQIPIYPLSEGKVIQDIQPDGTKVARVSYMKYNEIKAKRQISNPDGTKKSTYNYFVVLYIGIPETNEVLKLKFKGNSRGNYFDYSKLVSGMGAQIYNVVTEFSTALDTMGKYMVLFEVAKDEKGNPLPVDSNQVRNMRVQVATQFLQFSNGPQIGAPAAQPALNSADQDQGRATPQEEAAMHLEPIESEDDDIPAPVEAVAEPVKEDDGKIKIEDVPFP